MELIWVCVTGAVMGFEPEEILAVERGTYVRIENMVSRTIPIHPGERGFRAE